MHCSVNDYASMNESTITFEKTLKRYSFFKNLFKKGVLTTFFRPDSKSMNKKCQKTIMPNGFGLVFE